jgi:hypothetical protein
MAKKRKAAKGGKKSSAVKPSEVMKMPPASAVKSLAAELSQADDRNRRNSKTMSERVAVAKSSKGIHPAALKRVVAKKRKAEASARGCHAVATQELHEAYYADVLGLTAMLEKQGEMFARGEAGETEPKRATYAAAGDAHLKSIKGGKADEPAGDTEGDAPKSALN